MKTAIASKCPLVNIPCSPDAREHDDVGAETLLETTKAQDRSGRQWYKLAPDDSGEDKAIFNQSPTYRDGDDELYPRPHWTGHKKAGLSMV